MFELVHRVLSSFLPILQSIRIAGAKKDSLVVPEGVRSIAPFVAALRLVVASRM